MNCINTNLAEFRMLSKQSGLPDSILAAICGDFVGKHNRFPYLDEIPGANSSKYIVEQLDVKDGHAKTDSVLEFTNSQTISDALKSLNNTYRDLVVELYQVGDDTKVYIEKRPTSLKTYGFDRDSVNNSRTLFQNIINKLQTLYGIKVNKLTLFDIQNSELKLIPGVSTAKAFVYNGEIYINTDLADADAPIHEMMHLLMGGLKTSDPDLYYQIVESVAETGIVDNYRDSYQNRTLNDLAEEAFVGEFSKFVTGIPSVIDNLPNEAKYEMLYNAKRVLDSILMGKSSVLGFNNNIFMKSLLELSSLVDSNVGVMKSNFSFEGSAEHRKLANLKLELLEKQELLEVCNG